MWAGGLAGLLGLSLVLIGGIGRATADAAAGPADIADKAALCAACHGQAGISGDPATIPIINGQAAAYLMKQLRDYRRGDRDNPVMAEIARSLDEADLRPLARHFGGAPWPAPDAAPAASGRPEGGRPEGGWPEGGRPEGGRPAGLDLCEICHQPGLRGGLPGPRLAGLDASYLLAQMNAFADGRRGNSQDMQRIMQGTGAEERAAMARYLSGL